MDYDKILNPTVVKIKPSGIRKFFDIAAEMDDVISLGVGEPDFQTPWHIRQAGIASLQDGKTKYTANSGLIELRRRFMVHGFNSLGLTCFEPLGAFYAFPSIKSTGLSSEEFCEKLLYSKKVAIVPGTAFGESGEGHVRASYCYSMEHIREALRRICEFLEEMRK